MKKSHFTAFMLLLVLPFCFASCSKEGNSITSTGPVIRQTRVVADFDTVALCDDLDLILVQDSVNRVIVEAGENIISGISTDVANGILSLKNHNTFNWLRSYDKPLNVYVHTKNLHGLFYNSAGNVTCENTIQSSYLLVDVLGGAGSINILMNVYEGYFYLRMGTADIHLRGKCFGSMIYAGDLGLMDCKDLLCTYAEAKNYGSNNCYVRADKFLDLTIGSIGDIYYYGDPDTLRVHIFGDGSVIRGK